MSTQIYITPIIPEDNCKVNHIKVATLASSFNTSDGYSNNDDWAFIGGGFSWMSNPTDFSTTALGGNILNVPTGQPSMAIILPVDVDVNDVITLQGIAHGKSDVLCRFLIGVSYVSCEDFIGAKEKVNVNTLIPAQPFPARPKPEFNVCFSLETTGVTLPAGTLLYVGVNCPTFDLFSADCNFSYTLDITKSCAPIPVITNVRIQNCCEQAVFEVISLNTQNLPASGTFSDTEGNCWTIIGITSDPIDTVRFVDTPYQDCAACLIANPCPMNLIVESCCSGQSESFTGSLPGIVVGQTFLDTYGFCWNVTEETSGPITGLVTVDSAYENCETCTLSPGACPQVYQIVSCCRGLKVFLYTTLELLGSGVAPGDTFMDQYGYCWTISPAFQPGFTVNAAFIQAVTNYGNTAAACETCLLDLNNCTVPVIYKVQNCCSGVIEYVSYDFGLNVDDVISISTIVTPSEFTCYTVLDWDNTTTPTITIDTFDGVYRDCEECGRCPNFYIAYDCAEILEPQVVYTIILGRLPYSFVTNDGNCWFSKGEITSGPATITVSQNTKNCEICSTQGFYTAVACYGEAPNEVIFVSDTVVGLFTRDVNNGLCYQITTPTSGPATIQSNGAYSRNCETCLTD
jgi:hypothetical protein